MVFATETNALRRDMALAMGADVVLDPATTDAVACIQSETIDTGVDVLLEMSGSPAAIQQGFRALRAGGRASLLGIPTESVALDLVNDVIFKGATVQGIYGRRMYETWVQMTALLKTGRLKLDPLFGERITFTNRSRDHPYACPTNRGSQRLGATIPSNMSAVQGGKQS
jgi:threonine 3-dehydrogenase